MNLLLWGLTFGTVGKLVLGVAVLRVHIRMFQEHSFDSVVLRAIHREHYITIVGLFLIVLGYALEVAFYNGATELLSCVGPECVGAIQAAFN